MEGRHDAPRRHGELPEDLERTVARLRAERPSASPLELDALQRRVHARLSSNRHHERTQSMKSRIAVTLMLVFGVGLSTTGAGLAVTGSSGQGNAAQVVYNQPTGTTPLNPQPTPTQATPQPTPQVAQTPPAATPQGAVQGETVQGETPAPASEDQGGVAGVQDESAESAPVSPVRVADQAEVADTTAGDSLPFTGFSAIPVLLAGLALMVGGLFMHRRTSVARL